MNQVALSKKATVPNGRLYHALATVKAPKKSGILIVKPNWQIIVDEATCMKFASYFEKKEQYCWGEPICKKLALMQKVAGKDISKGS